VDSINVLALVERCTFGGSFVAYRLRWGELQLKVHRPSTDLHECGARAWRNISFDHAVPLAEKPAP
jgi:hypothetical protein